MKHEPMNKLKFKNDGSFRLMQITDTQEDSRVSPDTLQLINAALDKAKPDLVIFTGDQLKGYSAKFRGRNKRENVKNTIDALTKPMIERNIPFAVTFGNHDRQALSEKEQIDFYTNSPLCLNPKEKIAENYGTFNIPIYSSEGESPVFNLYIIHSEGDAKGGGYESVTEETIRWYQSTRDRLKAENGKYIPSLIFQHIPVDEYYKVLKKADKRAKSAVRAYRTHKNEYYVLSDEMLAEGQFMREPPSVPDKNSGQFEAIAEKGDVLGIWVGHDHKNSFVGKYKGVDLGYTQNAGFNVYGEGLMRGVRIFDLSQKEPHTYKTHTLSFAELVGRKVKKPLKDYLYKKVPTTVDAAIPLVLKTLLAAIALIAGIILLIKRW